MLSFPDLGSQPEVSQSRQKLRMSVEQPTVAGNQKEVNTFLTQRSDQGLPKGTINSLWRPHCNLVSLST